MALADSTRDEVALRLRIETSRSAIRSGVRTVLVFSVVFAVGLALEADPPPGATRFADLELLLALVGNSGWHRIDPDGRSGPAPSPGASARIPGRGAMTVALGLGALVGLGAVGIVYSLRPAPPSLQSIVEAMNGSRLTASTADMGSRSLVLGRSLTSWLTTSDVTNHPWWEPVRQSLTITGERVEDVATKALVGMGVGLVGPPLVWVVATQIVGVELSPVLVPVAMAVIAVPAGACLPVVELQRRARDRRRHFRVVISSFIDLVVLGLAGGVGVEGALFAASQMRGDWAARRISRALAKGRDSGRSPWAALGALGDDVGVVELIELSSTLELAGTEGARVRQSLQARAVSFRRHEQADAESTAEFGNGTDVSAGGAAAGRILALHRLPRFQPGHRRLLMRRIPTPRVRLEMLFMSRPAVPNEGRYHDAHPDVCALELRASSCRHHQVGRIGFGCRNRHHHRHLRGHGHRHRSDHRGKDHGQGQLDQSQLSQVNADRRRSRWPSSCRH